MVWVIIIGIFLLAIAPIFWVLPTSAQRHQMKLRNRAMQSGLVVQLAQLLDRDAPAIERVTASGRTREVKRACVAYRLPLRGVYDERPLPEWHIDHMRLAENSSEDLPSNWRWLGERPDVTDRYVERVASVLAKVPPDTVAVEARSDAVSIYWRESGDVENVDRVAELLRDLEDIQKASLETESE
jgi:hypothetical protein